MITLSNGDKLMSMQEVLTRVRGQVGKYLGELDALSFEIKMLAVALDESEDFIRGAIEPRRLSANSADLVERKVRGRRV